MEAWPFRPKEDTVLDVKPLRSMAPVTQFLTSVANNTAPELDLSANTSISGKKSRRRKDGPQSEVSEIRRLRLQRKKALKIKDLAFTLSSSPDPREWVEGALMAFDALRRRLLQLDVMTDARKRADLKAGAIMLANNLRVNKGKKIGLVPGVEIGDIFFFRIEMCLLGLHAQSMSGIDYMVTKHGDSEEFAAMSVVSAGGYENVEGDADVLIYTGQGGGTGNKHAEKVQLDDQKLERGNLALEKSLHRGNPVRVIRSVRDMNCLSGKIYIYDGLYKIRESWIEKGRSGYNIFKYKLIREPGQVEGFSLWKRIGEWRINPSSRSRVLLADVSSGIENIPVLLVNEIDVVKGLSHFAYSTAVKYMNPINTLRPMQGCRCFPVCLPGDSKCSCAQQNEGNLPFCSGGLLASRKTIAYECNSSCCCSVNCRNRVTQKGIKLHFEIFRTRERGWGLRSRDPIRAGSFICEYTGEFTEKMEVDDGEDDMYNFRAAFVDEKTLKWNHGPELLGEPSANWGEIIKPLPIRISAKNFGNISRFMNHSCSPNVFWQPVLHDHSEEAYPHIMFFAIKHIPPMTELTFDYGGGLGGFIGIWGPKKCLCGSRKCRGYFY